MKVTVGEKTEEHGEKHGTVSLFFHHKSHMDWIKI